MATKVEKSIVVERPVETVYNQWTQFEEFPHFMGGISEIRQLDDTTMQWTAEIGGVKRQWKAAILEQVPNQKIAWAATEGATNAGAVYFSSAGTGRTAVRLELEYEPEGIVESVADKVGVVGRRAEADLEKFKSFIEDEGYETGAWRGTVPGAAGTPGVEAAGASRGDSGAAGVSGKAIAAGAGVAAAAAAGVAAALKSKSGDGEEEGSSAAASTVPSTTTSETIAPASSSTESSTTVTPAEPVAPVDPIGPDTVSPDPLGPDAPDADRRL